MSNPQPLISIVTISFNQGEFLNECIDSVVQQDYPQRQYVVVDPGSTDQSRAIIQARQADINHAVLEPDQGPADGLNQGFQHCNGDIYAYINADDRFVPGAFAYAATFFQQHPKVDVLCGAIRMINRDGHASPRKRTSDPFDIRRYVAGINTIGQQATFFRAAAFQAAGGFNPANRVTWDGELLVDMALAGCQFQSVNKVLGDFRIYGDTITGGQGYLQRYHAEMQRVKEKVQRQGVTTYTDRQAAIARLAYKFNIARHLGYLLVR